MKNTRVQNFPNVKVIKNSNVAISQNIVNITL